jgi:hypothetical protein
MKKLLTVLFLSAISLASQAQEKYVEVVVTDTVMVEPQEWTLILSIQPSYEYAVDTMVALDTMPVLQSPVKEPVIEEGTTIQQLKDLAKKHGASFPAESGAAYSVTGRNPYQSENLIVNFKSRKKMDAFFKELVSYKDVNGKIFKSTHTQLQPFQQALEMKLIAAAKLKAARLAALNNKKLGDILVISEVTESEAGSLRSFFEELIRSSEGNRTQEWMSQDKIRIEKSLKLRFALL